MRAAATTPAGLVLVLLAVTATGASAEPSAVGPRGVTTWGDGGCDQRADGQGATVLNSFRFTVCAHRGRGFDTPQAVAAGAAALPVSDGSITVHP
ncbi:hypothetical protein [Actinomycetospora sp. TBRC 11914]|uniref:hypothetical protein n=1 Tax=Actinomycetospora sp. TBRC 11914 TaxID=2729387 RepID=UPI00145F5C74|nr:hypothetical protein [Actinomycetospora sp. TBRC 11914]NMO89754.1 hypothetical protein [Actinomycetospora sp. TBRC 11914]